MFEPPTFRVQTQFHGPPQYLLLPAGGIDAHQAGVSQEAAAVQTQADEVGRAVGGGAHQQAAARDPVIYLRGGEKEPFISPF